MLFGLKIGTGIASQANTSWGAGLLLNGILCVCFGLAIIAAPELLAYIVAMFLIILGSISVAAGWKLRQLSRR